MSSLFIIKDSKSTYLNALQAIGSVSRFIPFYAVHNNIIDNEFVSDPLYYEKHIAEQFLRIISGDYRKAYKVSNEPMNNLEYIDPKKDDYLFHHFIMRDIRRKVNDELYEKMNK